MSELDLNLLRLKLDTLDAIEAALKTEQDDDVLIDLYSRRHNQIATIGFNADTIRKLLAVAEAAAALGVPVDVATQRCVFCKELQPPGDVSVAHKDDCAYAALERAVAGLEEEA